MRNMREDNDNRTSPVGLLNVGKEYNEACKIITEKCPDKHPSLPNTDLYKVRLYLIGHSFELLFKAVLLQHGVSVVELKSKKFGHNLSSLADKVKEFINLPFSDAERATLELLNWYYKDKDFEYHIRGSKEYPLVADLLCLSNRLFKYVEKQFRIQLVLKDNR